MKIIIIGAGKVGYTLAESLSRENHDVIIIDKNEAAINHASDALDVMCIKGSGASPAILKAAGADTADFVLACTSLDEVNMLCSLTAKHLGAKYTVARIRDVEYTAELALFQRDMSIDMVINPEYAAAIEMSQLLRFPTAAEIDTFFRGRVEMIGTMVQEGDFIIGRSLASLAAELQRLPFLFCAAQRGGKLIIPKGDFVPQKGDQLYLIGSPMGLQQYFRRLGRYMQKVHSVFMVGGSRIAHYLAKMLDQMHVQVTIVDNQESRCRFLSEKLPNALILHGDGTDQELLATEHFSSSNAFIALTGRDEDNLLISLYARQQGIRKVITKCNRDNYTAIAHSAGLESILSPKMIAVSRILRVVRAFENKKGSIMTALYHFADNKAEAAEFEITETAQNLNTPIRKMHLKHGVLIAALLHHGQIIIPSGNTTITPGDKVIIISHDQLIQDFNDIFDKGN